MGGLAARNYITSDYYQNDVKKLITLDTPHLGADGLAWYKRYKQDYGLVKAIGGNALDFAIQNLLKGFIPLPEDLYVSGGHLTTSIMSIKLNQVWNKGMEWANKDSFKINEKYRWRFAPEMQLTEHMLRYCKENNLDASKTIKNGFMCQYILH